MEWTSLFFLSLLYFKGFFRSVSRGIEIEIQTSEQLGIGYLTSKDYPGFK